MQTPVRRVIAFVDYVLEPTLPGRSGLSDIVWDMASELINYGYECHVIASYKSSDYPDNRVIVHNFPTPPIGYRNQIGHLWILKRAADTAKSLNPDIICAPEYVSTAVFASLGVRIPMVVIVPGNIFHKLSVPNGSGYEWNVVQMLKWAARKTARTSSCIIAISKEMKNWWEWTGSAPERTPWIPIGVNAGRFQYIEGARDALSLPAERILLLYVGRFSKEKGVLELLHALRMLKESRSISKLQVSLIGKGPQESLIKSTVLESGLESVVTVHSWVHPDMLSAWYSAADALLLPSHSEALPRTLLEAMNCGTPVIGTRVSGIEDHVVNGKTGYLVPPHNEQALCRVLNQVLDNPDALRRMRPATREYARENLTWPKVVKRIISEVYEPIIAGKLKISHGE